MPSLFVIAIVTWVGPAIVVSGLYMWERFVRFPETRSSAAQPGRWVRLSLDDSLQPDRQASFCTLKSSDELSYVGDSALTHVFKESPAIVEQRFWTVSLN